MASARNEDEPSAAHSADVQDMEARARVHNILENTFYGLTAVLTVVLLAFVAFQVE